jgi:type IV secretion system protein VirB10
MARLKLDRNMVPWIAFGTLFLFLFTVIAFRGRDLGQSSINKKNKQEQMAKTAQALQERVQSPQAATQQALARAQQAVRATPIARGAPGSAATAAASNIPAMPPVDALKLAQYANTIKELKEAPGAGVANVAGGGDAPTGAVLHGAHGHGGSSFVMYASDESTKGAPGAVAVAGIPLYKPVKAPAHTKPVGGQPANGPSANAPAAAASTPLNVTNDGDVRVAKTEIMAQRANGMYWLSPGTVINAVLLNAVNTLLPGSLTARVTENVYDSRFGTHLVIPAGSVLMGKYKDAVQDGQNRVFMAFDTLSTPYGGVVSLGNMSAGDALGRAGLAGDLHTHFWKRIGISTLLALEAVGMDRLSPSQSTVGITGSSTSPAADGAQIIASTANQELQRRYSVKPNITMPSGMVLTIVTTGSIEVPPIANTR